MTFQEFVLRRAVTWWAHWPRNAAPRLAVAVAVVVLTSACMIPFRSHLGVLNVGLIFLLVIFVLALFTGGSPAVVAAVLSFLAFNYLFIPPFRTLQVSQGEDVVMLAVYLGVAITTGQLVARIRLRT